MITPNWALTLAYWLHMCATVIWIGGLAGLSLFILPAARKTLTNQSLADFLGQVGRYLDRWGWFSLLVLLVTGMFQMSANPNYDGFLALDSRWALAILTKHIAFLVMIAVSAYLTWGLLPGLERIALRRARQPVDKLDRSLEADLQALQKREITMLRVNLILGILVLALTSIARAV